MLVGALRPEVVRDSGSMGMKHEARSAKRCVTPLRGVTRNSSASLSSFPRVPWERRPYRAAVLRRSAGRCRGRDYPGSQAPAWEPDFESSASRRHSRNNPWHIPGLEAELPCSAFPSRSMGTRKSMCLFNAVRVDAQGAQPGRQGFGAPVLLLCLLGRGRDQNAFPVEIT